MSNREPIKNTCPTIDRAISRLDQIKSWCKDIIYECESAERELEDIRHANSELRDWGNKEADRVDELENEIEDLKTELTAHHEI